MRKFWLLHEKRGYVAFCLQTRASGGTEGGRQSPRIIVYTIIRILRATRINDAPSKLGTRQQHAACKRSTGCDEKAVVYRRLEGQAHTVQRAIDYPGSAPTPYSTSVNEEKGPEFRRRFLELRYRINMALQHCAPGPPIELHSLHRIQSRAFLFLAYRPSPMYPPWRLATSSRTGVRRRFSSLQQPNGQGHPPAYSPGLAPEPFWQLVRPYRDVSQKDFLSYRWQVCCFFPAHATPLPSLIHLRFIAL